MQVPDWLVHEYNPNLYIIRQSGCLDFEKPFVFLMFGKDRGLLLDTGSRNFPAAEMVQNVVGKWLKRNNRPSIELLVVHTHPHSDHVAGDEALKHLQSSSISIKLIPPTIEDSKAFYGIANWPDQAGTVDLGGRVIDAIPIPGHSAVSIAFYDRNTAILFTGDSLYPGRLYVNDWDAFVKSTRRLVDFTKGKLISHILGNHIEQSRTAFLDYPVGTIYQPNEHALAMSRGDLLELMDALSALHEPTRLAMSGFTIWPAAPDSEPHGRALENFKAREKKQLEQMWDQPSQY
jgi:hydroxyacylglutathione hydrolase